MSIREIINFFQTIAPLSLQESYDNAGLQAGDPAWDCSGALLALDLTPEVVQEAVKTGCNLVIIHHPLIFRALKSVSAADAVGGMLVECIKHDIAVYAIHTNLDNILEGVNGKMASMLGLRNTRVLAPLEGKLRKLAVFVPVTHLDKVREAIWSAGAGRIGRYSDCSFSTTGTGTFRAGEGTSPYVGEYGVLHSENEARLEVVFPAPIEKAVIEAMISSHPYEEVAYDLVPLQNSHPGMGAGLVGELMEPVSETDFLTRVKDIFRIPVIRHSAFTGRLISRVAICGGAGSFLISNALAVGAEVFLTADLKYHQFFEPAGRMLLADIGHYESEQFTPDLLVGLLKEKFPTFAVLKTGLNTNPVHYFYS